MLTSRDYARIAVFGVVCGTSASGAGAQGLSMFRAGVDITHSNTYESPGLKPSTTQYTWRMEVKGNVLAFGALRTTDGARGECLINSVPSNIGLLFAPNKTMSGEFRCDPSREGTPSHFVDSSRWIKFRTHMRLQGPVVTLTYDIQSTGEKVGTKGDLKGKEVNQQDERYVLVLNLAGPDCRVLRATGTGTYQLSKIILQGGNQREDQSGTIRLNPLIDTSCKFVQ